jgi:predicted dehydrogenase
MSRLPKKIQKYMPAPSKSVSKPFRIGVIGCGAISNAYFQHLAPFSSYAKITACADIDLDRARAKAKEHGVPKACSVKELLLDPEIDAVLNLTIPAAHATVNMAAVKAGKHVYCEKPFSLSYKEGLRVLKEAQKRKLRLGCAPDTVLGGGIQTARQLIDQGAIGRPIGAVANMLSHGVESWHPNPWFYYQKGGGPLFDMGPYYLTSLVLLMGPVKSVSALARKSFKERTITNKIDYGKKIKVEVPTHLSGELEMVNGAIATVTMSFDVWANKMPLIEIYGTEGSLSVPDPNTFGGDVMLWTTKKPEWTKIPLTHSDQIGRGVGIADLAFSEQTKKRQHRLNGELALHVVEVMESFHKSSDTGRKIMLKSRPKQPEPLKAGLPVGQLS